MPYIALNDPEPYFPNDAYIVSVEIRDLRHNLIVPYPETDMRQNTAFKRAFNRAHSQTPMTIDRAFGILKVRWRFLGKEVCILDYEDVVGVVTTACILHNIYIDIANTHIIEDVEKRCEREARQAM
ncbi:unnamed protein product [Rhizopus stolonifer]